MYMSAMAHQRHLDEQDATDRRIEVGRMHLTRDLETAYWSEPDPDADIRTEIEAEMGSTERYNRIGRRATDNQTTMRDLVDHIREEVREVCEDIASRYDTVQDIEERAYRDWGV